MAEPDPRANDEAAPGIHADPTWPADGGSDEEGATGDADQDSSNASSLQHVPIKRKGSPKR